jgi:hypothetical protein
MTNHIVYAGISTPYGHNKYRVSDPLPWGDAIDRWHKLDNERIAATYPGSPCRLLVAGTPVKFFVVRSESDPEWPGVAGVKFHILARIEPVARCATSNYVVVR